MYYALSETFWALSFVDSSRASLLSSQLSLLGERAKRWPKDRHIEASWVRERVRAGTGWPRLQYSSLEDDGNVRDFPRLVGISATCPLLSRNPVTKGDGKV
jgi:hypothetical protein